MKEAIEYLVGGVDPGICRVKLTLAGLVIEADATGKHESYEASLYERIMQEIWGRHYDEIIYSIYTFRSDKERFLVEGALRQIRTEQTFNMSTSVLGSNDVYCRFTRFDFDVLTLSNRDESTEGLFVIDDSSPSKIPSITFKELDIMGHQFAISSKAEKDGNHYKIKLITGLDLP